MRDTVAKKIMLDSYSNWSGKWSKTFLSFIVDHETHALTFDYEGVDPHIKDFVEVCLKDKDILKEMLWGINAHRANFAFVKEREGQSRCRDISLCFTGREGNEASMALHGTVAVNLHISMCGKIQPRFRIWSGDLAMILSYIRPFGIHKGRVIFINEYCQNEGKPYKIKMRFKYLKLSQMEQSKSIPVENIRERFNTFSGFDNNGNEKIYPERRPRRPRRPRDREEG